jgi:hypothetical protein
MNAVDAGATKCDIELTPQILSIRDNGKGFKSKEEIEQFFEVFGQPHDDMEDKTFGQFRMGRGQLFAYGRNTWRTGKFAMSVDIDKDGLDYHMEEGLSHEDGCHIHVELYTPLTHTAHAEMLDQLEQNCRYVSLVLNVNGRQINKVPTTQKWEIESAEASIRFRQNGYLVVYNQGIKVCEFPRHRLGCGGEVVTKQNLKVNFARNDIMSDCPVWAKIQQAILGQTNAQQTRPFAALPAPTTGTVRERRPRAPATTEADRVRLCGQAKDKQLTPSQLASAKLFLPLCSHTNISLTMLHNRCDGKFTVAPEQASYNEHERGRSMVQHKLAFPLAHANLRRWGLTDGCDFISALKVAGSYYTLDYIPWGDMVARVDERKLIVQEKDMTRVEAIVLATIRKHAANLCYRLRRSGGTVMLPRTIQLGDSKSGDSWTDGKKVIVINRNVANSCGCGPFAWINYGLLILHEMAHQTSTLKDHGHTPEFYRAFHDCTTQNHGRSLSWFASRCAADCPQIAERIDRRMSRTELAMVDHQEACTARVTAVVGAEATAAVPPPPPESTRQ